MYFLEGFEDRYESLIGEGYLPATLTISKSPGDKFRVYFTLKNTGNVNLTLNIELYGYKKGGSETADRAFSHMLMNETLNVGQEKRYPSTGYFEFDVTQNISPGIYNCVLRVFDTSDGTMLRRTEVTDAWNVAIVKSVSLIAIEVG